MEDDSFVDTSNDLIHEALQDVSSYHETIRQTTSIQHSDDDDDSKQSESDNDSYEQNVNDTIMSSLQQKLELLTITSN